MNIESFVEGYGLVAIFLLMFGESAFVPFPSEITMTFSGYLVGKGTLVFSEVVIVGFLGNMLGALFTYYLGRTKGYSWSLAAIRKWGQLFLIDEGEFKRVRAWFRKYGSPIVLVSRIMPVVRAFVSLPAGISQMSLVKFTILTSLGTFIWVFGLTYIGKSLGEQWLTIENYIGSLDRLVLLVLTAFMAFILYKMIKRRLV